MAKKLALIVDEETTPRYARFPVVSLAAEHLVMGCLLRRNILTYKAPPGNEGYDLIAMHPDPRKAKRTLRIQVKSRMATDADEGFPISAKVLDAFDFLVVVRLNVGYYFKKAEKFTAREGAQAPVFYTLTPRFVSEHHDGRTSWAKVYHTGLDMSAYQNEIGFEHIAKHLGVAYPSKGR
ncbi:MAG: hypothetical protein ACR2HE_09670 [Casimicrobiaceae bacterium]